jgi:hypothetical protein
MNKRSFLKKTHFMFGYSRKIKLTGFVGVLSSMDLTPP